MLYMAEGSSFVERNREKQSVSGTESLAFIFLLGNSGIRHHACYIMHPQHYKIRFGKTKTIRLRLSPMLYILVPIFFSVYLLIRFMSSSYSVSSLAFDCACSIFQINVCV
ncbi:unnamed protein product [Orchesella dallaii]|uniref:Uncharacterized protein n=1 Tax=Orchesella dallaii TaxID=48710 RepID=A0ABP1RSC8_9HEXA